MCVRMKELLAKEKTRKAVRSSCSLTVLSLQLDPRLFYYPLLLGSCMMAKMVHFYIIFSAQGVR